MKISVLMMLAGALSLGLSSCFLITVPMKATGEIIEKSAYATRDLSARGMRKMRESRNEGQTYDDGAYDDSSYGTGPDYGSDRYYEEGR